MRETVGEEKGTVSQVLKTSRDDNSKSDDNYLQAAGATATVASQGPSHTKDFSSSVQIDHGEVAGTSRSQAQSRTDVGILGHVEHRFARRIRNSVSVFSLKSGES